MWGWSAQTGGRCKVVKTSEGILVERCRRGSMDAFEELVRQYERKVYSIAYRMTGNHEDACDLAQEAFLRVYRNIATFRGKAMFSTWLYRIATNVCLDELRRRRRYRADSLDEPVATANGEMAREMANHTEGPDGALERKEMQRVIREAVGELSPDHRMVVTLRDFEGFSYEEIAGVLNCSLGTVKSRLSRARHELKDILSKRLELLPRRGSL